MAAWWFGNPRRKAVPRSRISRSASHFSYMQGNTRPPLRRVVRVRRLLFFLFWLFKLFVEVVLISLLLLLFRNEMKPDSADAVQQLKDRGKRLHTRSHDNEHPLENATETPLDNSSKHPHTHIYIYIYMSTGQVIICLPLQEGGVRNLMCTGDNALTGTLILIYYIRITIHNSTIYT